MKEDDAIIGHSKSLQKEKREPKRTVNVHKMKNVIVEVKTTVGVIDTHIDHVETLGHLMLKRR